MSQSSSASRGTVLLILSAFGAIILAIVAVGLAAGSGGETKENPTTRNELSARTGNAEIGERSTESTRVESPQPTRNRSEATSQLTGLESEDQPATDSPLQLAQAHFGGQIGGLSQEGVEFAKLYIVPGVEQAAEALDSTDREASDVNDMEVLQADADALVQERLWEAVNIALDQGHYIVAPKRKSHAVFSAEGVFAQQLSVREQGVFKDVRFILTRDRDPGLFAAMDHRASLRRSALHEAARAFNALDFEQRREQYERYQRLVEDGSQTKLNSAQRIVPHGCHVERPEFRMIVLP